MRTIIFTTALSFLSLFLLAQNVGIGTTSPIARLHVADSNVVFTGPVNVPFLTTYNPPIQGAGTRMMWYPQKAAFRAGGVDGTQWDKDNIGMYSFASGFNTKAGYLSTAMGLESVASGWLSTALGSFSISSGYNTLAAGEYATASQDYAIALGRYATATNFSAVSIGEKNTASGAFSVAMGIVTKALGESSASFGNNTVSKARGGFTTGLYNDTLDFPDYNVSSINDRIFQIGNGIDGARSNAITVLRNANIGIGNSSPHAPLQLATTFANRKIVLYEVADNDHQFQGFGINSGVLRYQVNQTGDDHVFYAGTSPTTSNELMRIKGNGNVGIGTSTPSSAKLVIKGTAGQEGLDLSSADQYANLRVIRNSLGSDKDMYIGLGSGAASSLHLFSNNNETITLKGGNVGIGNSSPHAPLQLATTFANRKIVLYEVADNDHQFEGFGMNAGILRYQVNQTGDDHVFYAGTSPTTSNELMRIKGNGNVGIGISALTYKLQVGSSNNGVRIEGPVLSGGVALSIGGFGDLQIDQPGTAGGRFIIKDNGNVGVGNAAPKSTLDVIGTIATKVNYRSGNSGNIALDNTGTVWIFSLNIGASITLPDPFSCPNRRYTIANRNNTGMAITNYYNLSGALVATIPALSSIELVSGGANWEQIR